MKTLLPGRMKQVSFSEDVFTTGFAGLDVSSVQSSSSAKGKTGSTSDAAALETWWSELADLFPDIRGGAASDKLNTVLS